jgi:hypothetical protein
MVTLSSAFISLTVVLIILAIACGIIIWNVFATRGVFAQVSNVIVGLVVLFLLIGTGCTTFEYLSADTLEKNILIKEFDKRGGALGNVVTSDNIFYECENNLNFEQGIKYKVEVIEMPRSYYIIRKFIGTNPANELITSITKTYPTEKKEITINKITYPANGGFFKIITSDNVTCYIPTKLEQVLKPGLSFEAEGCTSETGDFYITQMTSTGGV